MRASLAFFLLTALVAVPADAATRNYSVTSFTRIRVDGPYDVHLSTGVSPFARATGDWGAIDQLSLSVEGQTLVIRPPAGAPLGATGGTIRVEVGTADLTHAALNGAGRLSIDKVRGLAFDLMVAGAGSADIAAVDVDQFTVGLQGVAGSRLGGKARSVRAIVRGTSTLDASALQVNDMKLGAEGAAVARLNVRDTLALQAAGPVTVAVEGSPACTVKAQGATSIVGCRD